LWRLCREANIKAQTVVARNEGENVKGILSSALVVLAAMSSSVKAQENVAEVHIYRPHARYIGVALSPSVHCNGQTLSKLPNGRYFDVSVAPGEYTFLADDMEKMGKTAFKVEAGKNYYLRVSFVTSKKKMFFSSSAYRLEVEQIPQQEATDEMSKLSRLDPVTVHSCP
jgi:hypothetical protein